MILNTLLRRAICRRPGIAALFFGVRLPLFLGLVALSVNLSVVAVARIN
jgi:hypothetical protein